MIESLPLLSLITFLPLVGVLFILTIPRAADTNARWVALWVSLATFALSLTLWFQFDRTTADFQFVEYIPWIEDYNISYHMGVDGISVLFVLLSTFLIPICILASWTAITSRLREYMIAFLVLETLMVGMFCALDLFVFYVFFEAVLIPMFLIIGIWGGENRVYASFKFFLYTLAGSVLMLIAVLAMYLAAGTSSIPDLMAFNFPTGWQIWMWLAFFASFAVKVPMWPVHTWLPDAHVQAPTAGSVILAGVLLKMGGYGFLRFSLPIFPYASDYFIPLVFGLSVVAVIYTSLVALAQKDMKKLIAYSSVAHMGFVTLGIFTMNLQGIQGSILQMISHGLVSGALFLCVGVLYDRLHTKEISRFGGLVHIMPMYAFFFMIFTMASIGLPGTSGFSGEFLILTGAFKANTTVTFLAAIGVVLGAAYMLWLYKRVIFGKLEKADLKQMPDLSVREITVFVPLAILVFWIGIYPNDFLEIMEPSVSNLIDNYHLAMHSYNTPQLAGL